MIVDHLENVEKMLPQLNLTANIARGLKFLKENDLTALAEGKHVIDGDNLFVNINVYQTKEKTAARSENHAQYIDIQCIIEGEEVIAYAPFSPDLEVDEVKPERDIVYYRPVQNETEIIMKCGMFAIFFPWDVHKTSCTYQNKCQVKKALVKIKI